VIGPSWTTCSTFCGWRPDEPVDASGRGWMTVGDLRWEMTTGFDERFG
jgi:hypothetical protein